MIFHFQQNSPHHQRRWAKRPDVICWTRRLGSHELMGWCFPWGCFGSLFGSREPRDLTGDVWQCVIENGSYYVWFYLYTYVRVISCYRIIWHWYTNHQVGMVIYYLRWCLYSVFILTKLIFPCRNPYLCKQYNAIWWVFLWLDSWTWCQFELILWELPKPPYVYPHLWSQIHQTSHGSNEPVSLLKPQSKVGRKKCILIRGALEKSTEHRETSTPVLTCRAKG